MQSNILESFHIELPRRQSFIYLFIYFQPCCDILLAQEDWCPTINISARKMADLNRQNKKTMSKNIFYEDNSGMQGHLEKPTSPGLD